MLQMSAENCATVDCRRHVIHALRGIIVATDFRSNELQLAAFSATEVRARAAASIPGFA